MKRILITIALFLPLTMVAKSKITSPQVKSLQVVVNRDWL